MPKNIAIDNDWYILSNSISFCPDCKELSEVKDEIQIRNKRRKKSDIDIEYLEWILKQFFKLDIENQEEVEMLILSKLGTEFINEVKHYRPDITTEELQKRFELAQEMSNMSDNDLNKLLSMMSDNEKLDKKVINEFKKTIEQKNVIKPEMKIKISITFE